MLPVAVASCNASAAGVEAGPKIYSAQPDQRMPFFQRRGTIHSLRVKKVVGEGGEGSRRQRGEASYECPAPPTQSQTEPSSREFQDFCPTHHHRGRAPTLPPYLGLLGSVCWQLLESVGPVSWCGGVGRTTLYRATSAMAPTNAPLGIKDKRLRGWLGASFSLTRNRRQKGGCLHSHPYTASHSLLILAESTGGRNRP